MIKVRKKYILFAGFIELGFVLNVYNGKEKEIILSTADWMKNF